MISDIEHLFTGLLAICTSSLEKWLFRVFAHYFIRFFLFLMLSFKSSLYILDIDSLCDVWENMLSHSAGCLFILLMVSFAVQNL